MQSQFFNCFFVLAAFVSVPQFLNAGDEIPPAFQGTWLLRLTSDNGGKSYKSGDGQPICNVTQDGVKFVSKVEYSDQTLIVKAVTQKKNAANTFEIVFTNGTRWELADRSGSITAVIYDVQEKPNEKYRITVRRKGN